MTDTTGSTNGSAEQGAALPWLVMVYMAGDNNLTEDMVLALQDLERERPPAGDVIVAQLDPSGVGLAAQRYDFTIPKRTLEDHQVPYTVAEPNTGTVRALVDFVDFSLNCAAEHQRAAEEKRAAEENRRPAEDWRKPLNYLLILSGHGSGTTEDFLLRDDESLDSLTIPELRTALEQVGSLIYTRTEGQTNRKSKLDIVGMDACYMGMGEVAFEIARYADVLIAPEGTAPAFGWPYGRLLAAARRLRQDNGRPGSPHELADSIVQEYVHHYSDYDRSAGRSVDLAAINLTKIEGLEKAVGDLSTALKTADKDRITLAHWYAQTYKSDQFIDLRDFCVQAYDRFRGNNDTVATACVQVIERLDRDVDSAQTANQEKPLTTRGRGCIIRSGCSGFAFQHSYGLAVHFPWAFVATDYSALRFAAATRWHEFLEKHVTETRREPRFLPNGTQKVNENDVKDRVEVLAHRRQRQEGIASLSEQRRSRIVAGAMNPDIAAEDRFREVDCRFRQVAGLKRNRYTGEGSRYTGEGSRYTGEGSRFPDDRQRLIKNLAIPGIGIAFWPRLDPTPEEDVTENKREELAGKP